jgi:hypothetical protein
LVAGLVKPGNRWWSDLADSAKWTADAALRLHSLTVDLRTAVALFKHAPNAMASLTVALREIHGTYVAVLDAIDLFLAPRKTGALEHEDYAAMARGRLRTSVAAKRGHCTAISLVYWSHGGIRSALSDASAADLEHLDKVFGTLGTADGDVFDAMAGIVDSLAGEASAIANLLIAGQGAEARARLDADANHLEDLEAAFNRQMGEPDTRRPIAVC